MFEDIVDDDHHQRASREQKQVLCDTRDLSVLMLSLSHRRLVSCIPHCRSFSSSPHLRGEAKSGEQTEGEFSTPKDPSFPAWKNTVGKQFEKPHRPCNWLGGKVVEFFPVCYSRPSCSPCTSTPSLALPVKPVLQASHPRFRCPPEDIISIIYDQPTG